MSANGRVPCKGRTRHWFTVWGAVGLRSPACMACGTSNPQPLTDADWYDLIAYQRMIGGRFREEIEEAIAGWKAAKKVQQVRELLLDGSCTACLEGRHPACTGRAGAFGGACSCQIDQHKVLLDYPATSGELAGYLT